MASFATAAAMAAQRMGRSRLANRFRAESSRRTEEHMATLRERLRARREAERRGLRSFTIGVSEDDLRLLAKQGYALAARLD